MRALGFTLIEVLITVAIVALIATIALPSYQDQIRRTRRAEARQQLMEIATAQERFYTNCNRYAATLNNALNTCSGLGRAAATVMSTSGYYQVSMTADGTAYTLTAAPQGTQVNDTQCASLSLTDAGLKGATGTLGSSGCW